MLGCSRHPGHSGSSAASSDWAVLHTDPSTRNSYLWSQKQRHGSALSPALRFPLHTSSCRTLTLQVGGEKFQDVRGTENRRTGWTLENNLTQLHQMPGSWGPVGKGATQVHITSEGAGSEHRPHSLTRASRNHRKAEQRGSSASTPELHPVQLLPPCLTSEDFK